MSTLDERDYREKNHWRRWCWNRIVERLDVPVREARVLYLAAERNLDAVEATRRGFKARNLIAVDHSAAKIRALRKAGTPCIHGDVFEIATAYRDRVDVLHLDFCAGMEISILSGLSQLACNPHYWNAVFCVNFLRGRDPSSNGLRGWLLAQMPPELRKHRGVAAFNYISSVQLTTMELGLEQAGLSHAYPVIEQELVDCWALTCRNVQTCYRSSSLQTFDTAVFINPMRFGREIFQAALPDLDYGPDPAPNRASRRVAAFKAVRTMRINGTLPKEAA